MLYSSGSWSGFIPGAGAWTAGAGAEAGATGTAGACAAASGATGSGATGCAGTTGAGDAGGAACAGGPGTGGTEVSAARASSTAASAVAAASSGAEVVVVRPGVGRLHHFAFGPVGFPSSMFSPQLPQPASARPRRGAPPEFLPGFNQVCERLRRPGQRRAESGSA